MPSLTVISVILFNFESALLYIPLLLQECLECLQLFQGLQYKVFINSNSHYKLWV